MKNGSKILVLTNYTCNNNCVFCSANSNLNFSKTRDTKEILDIITQNSHTYESIEFIGGEVTIRNDALQLIGASKESGYKEISIETNGRMFSLDEFCFKIMNAGLNKITFSLHGAKPETHDFLTKVNGSFLQSFNGLINASKYNVQLCVNFVINKYNYLEIPEFVEKVSKIKNISMIVFSYIKPQKHFSENLMIQYNKLIPVIEEIREYVIQAKIRFQYIPACLISDKGYLTQEHKSNVTKEYILSEQENLYSSLKNEFVKTDRCMDCMYFNICLGVPGDYYKIYGDQELMPLKNTEFAVDINHYE
jgi:MoaA/NifB/PqqE/SkfB family radical SAM enzyme